MEWHRLLVNSPVSNPFTLSPQLCPGTGSPDPVQGAEWHPRSPLLSLGCLSLQSPECGTFRLARHLLGWCLGSGESPCVFTWSLGPQGTASAACLRLRAGQERTLGPPVTAQHCLPELLSLVGTWPMPPQLLPAPSDPRQISSGKKEEIGGPALKRRPSHPTPFLLSAGLQLGDAPG